MFTSCCPGWVRFIKSQFPHYVDCLSTAKSPQQMFGAVAKTYFAEKIGVDPHRMFVVSIMPCMAKKSECALPTTVSYTHLDVYKRQGLLTSTCSVVCLLPQVQSNKFR